MVAVVLLGAGASFGSRDVSPETPPLGKDLFDRLEVRGGVASGLPLELKDLFRRDFEAGMAEYARTAGSVSKFQRELAEYLAGFTLGAANIYRRLVSKFGIDQVIYCSLNYDLLLEQAAASYGYGICYGTDRPNHHQFIRIIKPHGSCNVWPDIPEEFDLQASNCGIEIEAPVKLLNRPATLKRCAAAKSFAPAMSMFAVGKAVNVCPTWVQTQQAHWRNTVEVAEKIFVVGVRVHEVDTHIWEILGKSEAPLIYFGVTENDELEFNRWKRNSSKANAKFQKADFAESLSFMQI